MLLPISTVPTHNPLMVSLSNQPIPVLRQAQDERGVLLILSTVSTHQPLMVSLSNQPIPVLRQAQDERGVLLILSTVSTHQPLMVSLSNQPIPVLRQAQDERGLRKKEKEKGQVFQPAPVFVTAGLVPASLTIGLTGL